MANNYVAGLAYVGKPQIAYSTTKAALINFTRVTAVLYAPKNIRLNTVIPGLIHTPLVKMLADKYGGGDYETFVKLRNGQVRLAFSRAVKDMIGTNVQIGPNRKNGK
jgi:NAD(P)-dependent dehydrogenase (short-subunit alcohol dehydrogenase family)